jgi:SpoVK/Ycf46/Vps4 family AAA+-type ATPase
VVTVATTNDPASIDAAAKRAARFDRVVDVPPPDAAGRAAILTRYLRRLPGSVDATRVAAATDGATAADLRELVTLAVLHSSRQAGDGSGAVGTDLLLRLAQDAGYQVPTGQYL